MALLLNISLILLTSAALSACWYSVMKMTRVVVHKDLLRGALFWATLNAVLAAILLNASGTLGILAAAACMWIAMLCTYA